MAATNVFLQASNQGSTSKLSQNHSTIMNVPNSFRQISFDSWNKHQVTIADEHSWLESFMENVLIASTSKGKGFVVFLSIWKD